MSFLLTDDQQLIQRTARDFARDQLPIAHMRELRDRRDERGFDPARWREMAQLGFAGALAHEGEDSFASGHGVAGDGAQFHGNTGWRQHADARVVQIMRGGGQVAFGSRFGDLAPNRKTNNVRETEHPAIMYVSNRKENGRFVDQLPEGEMQFHIDQCYIETPNKATILHALGMDHRRLTYYFGGRDQRLTNFGGDPILKVFV